MLKKVKRIGIDARLYGPLGKGLGRYVQEVVDTIIKIDHDSQYVIFLSPGNFDEFSIASDDIGRIKKVLVNARWYSFKEQIILPFLIWREHLDLMHFPHFNIPVLNFTPFIVTIHDLILTKFPTVRATTLHPFIYRFKSWAYRFVIKSALQNSRQIISVSNFTKQDIIEQFGVAPEKIVVIYEGVANLAKGRDSLFVAKLDEEQTLSRHRLGGDFLLYIGNAYPHKNLESLLVVFKNIHQSYPGLKLVLVGKIDYFYSRVKCLAEELGLFSQENKDSAVIFPGYVPDIDLEILYKNARAYVFPSLYEGFGLPPLEAMAKSCPVVCSNVSSLPEILGDSAFYFNPSDQSDMEEKIKKILKDDSLRSNLIELGLVQAKKYSWWECASQTLSVYNKNC